MTIVIIIIVSDDESGSAPALTESQLLACRKELPLLSTLAALLAAMQVGAVGDRKVQ